MRKLKLAIDNLKVESFETATGAERHGTVAAHMPRPTNTEITGACCEYTLASCVQTNCLPECYPVETADRCA